MPTYTHTDPVEKKKKSAFFLFVCWALEVKIGNKYFIQNAKLFYKASGSEVIN